jgi:L-alanine-DL-glutamate epimerase-like enolase superfamily enzyme
MKLSIFNDRWEMTAPFVTSKEAINHIETITVCINKDGVCGKGEALGVDYLDESADSMRAQIESVRRDIESGIDSVGIQQMLPPGGARNALDCAMLDLQAKKAGLRAWDMLQTPAGPVNTV